MDNVIVMEEYIECLYATEEEKGTATGPLAVELELRKASEMKCAAEIQEFSRKGTHLQLNRKSQVKLLADPPFQRPEFIIPQNIAEIASSLVGTVLPSIKVKVFNAQPSHDVVLKNRPPTPVQLSAIADSSGIITMNIWGSKGRTIQIGSCYDMQKCRVKEYNNTIMLTSTKASSFRKIEELKDVVETSQFRFEPTEKTNPTTIQGVKQVSRKILCNVCQSEVEAQGKPITTCRGCKMTVLVRSCTNIRIVEVVTSTGQTLIFKDDALNSYFNGEFMDNDEELMGAILSKGEQV